jgi:hypothetical protein
MKSKVVVENEVKQGLHAQGSTLAEVAGSQCRWGCELNSSNAPFGPIMPPPSDRPPHPGPKLYADAGDGLAQGKNNE